MKIIGPRFFLPPFICGVQGRELNIYFENIVIEPVRERLIFSVSCEKGKQLRQRWTWEPTGEDVGSHKLSIEVRSLDDEILAAAETTIQVVPVDAGTGNSVTHLAIGDSFTAPSIYTESLMRLFSKDGPAYRLVGTHHPEGAMPGNVHEGYAGWKYITFVDKAKPDPGQSAPKFQKSPFVFEKETGPAFDFPRYIEERLGGSSPDFITVLLGPNDVSLAGDAEREQFTDRALEASRRLVCGLREGAPNARIGIISPLPPPMDQDVYGESYGCLVNGWVFRKNLYRLREKLFAEYHPRQAENIFFVPAYLNFDTESNFPRVTFGVHSQSQTMISRAVNAHPLAGGYRQLGDSIYAWLKWQLYQPPSGDR